MCDNTTTLYSVEPSRSTRNQRLRSALFVVTNGVPVTLTRMRHCLTAAEFRAYRDELQACYPRPTTSERLVLRRYNNDLREGDLQHARALKLKAVGMEAMNRQKHMRAAQHLYCRALERLDELLTLNPQLEYLFDRSVGEGEHADEPEGMPRYVNSSSEHTMHVSQQPHTADMAGIQANALRWSMKALESQTPNRNGGHTSPATRRSTRNALVEAV